jgi:hypothetical protein
MKQGAARTPRGASGYSGTPTAKKLGIKAGMRVCLVSAPKGFADRLTSLPQGVAFTAKVTGKSEPVCRVPP